MADNNKTNASDYNIQQAQELTEQNKKLKEQADNLSAINASYDKILKIQAQRTANLVRIKELTGEATAEVVAYAEAASNVNERLSDAVQLQENTFTRTAAVLRDIGELRIAQQKIEKDFYKQILRNNAVTGEGLDKLKENKKLQAAVVELTTIQLKLKEDGNTLSDQELALLEKKKNKLEKLLDAAEIQVEANAEITEEYHKQYKAVVDIKDANEQMARTAAKGLLWKSTEKFGSALGTATSAFGTMQGIAAEMYKSTGGNLEIIRNTQAAITEQQLGSYELSQYGIGFEEISESMVNLSQRSADFAFASQDVQRTVGLTAAKLQRLGVSTETSADLFNTLRLNFEMNADQFGSMADDMVEKSQAIGITVEQYTQDFQSSFPVLSHYGTNAINVFDKLARQARASGMSVQELAQSMSQFDTFEGAAESASKLNFLLGSQLDTTELLMADEADRLDMIKGAFSPSQFQNMDKFKKKAIAAAAGFSDVGAFEKAMRGDVEGLGDAAKKQADNLDSATKKSTAATLAFSKTLENTKDKIALDFVNLADNLGEDAHGLFGAGSVAAFAFNNMAGAAQMLNLAALAQMRAAAATMGGGLLGRAGGAKAGLMAKASGAMAGKTGLARAGALASTVGVPLLKAAGVVGVGMAAGTGISKAGEWASKKAGPGMLGSTLDIAGDAGGGALAGAAIGSVVPVIGTAAGAIVGGIGGALYSMFLESDERLSEQNEKLSKEDRKLAERTAKATEEANETHKKHLEETKRKNRVENMHIGTRANGTTHAENGQQR